MNIAAAIDTWRKEHSDEINEIRNDEWRQGVTDNLICGRYPEIFVERKNADSCIGRGIRIGDGWLVVLDELCLDLRLISGKFDIGVIATQVKSKKSTGFLRFYCRIIDNKTNKELSCGSQEERIVRAIISNSEKLSENICEVCGKSGEITSEFKSHRVLCIDHYMASCIINYDPEDCMETFLDHEEALNNLDPGYFD